MRNEVQLIAYADRLAGGLEGLRRLLAGPLHGVFGGVHVLPFYRSIDGADAGFDPTDHREVDPRVGTWHDVEALAGEVDVVADLIVNHVAAGSSWFSDVVARGDDSPWADMFLTYDAVFPDGATEADLLRVYRPRPGLPFSIVTVGGRPRLMWTTFTASQIDLDVTTPAGRGYLTEVLTRLARHGVRCVRLDAVGYAVKTPGTSCFMTPETFAFIADLAAQASGMGLEVLVEVHSYYERQIEIATQVDLVYDFALPPLLLHAVHAGDVAPLLHWLDVRPTNAVTVLDTHDGIGVVDVGADPDDPSRPGLLTPDQVSALVESLHTASRGVSRQATGWAAHNVDVYQVNCTWYDALGRDDARAVLTRLVQLFTPGIPQVYYVGLLAGANDIALLSLTGVGRDVNRHHYDAAEVEAALARPVVVATVGAVRLRSTHPAFGGTFACGPGEVPGSLWMEWADGAHRARLDTIPGQAWFRLRWTTGSGGETTVEGVQGLAEVARAWQTRESARTAPGAGA